MSFISRGTIRSRNDHLLNLTRSKVGLIKVAFVQLRGDPGPGWKDTRPESQCT